jgi:GNAT superfamily N-acetyltransferase
MPAERAPITVRRFRPEDRDFVLATVERLGAFGPPPWRTPAEIAEGEARTLRAHLRAPAAGADLLLAAAADGTLLGFAFLEAARDYFSDEEHGHVGMLALAAAAEGRGAGSALMAAAESWARARGYRRLTLNVFEGNRHAREVYEHLGYVAETRRYVKLLRPAAR